MTDATKSCFTPKHPRPPQNLIDDALRAFPNIITSSHDASLEQCGEYLESWVALCSDFLEAGFSMAVVEWAIASLFDYGFLKIDEEVSVRSTRCLWFQTTPLLWEWWRDGCPLSDIKTVDPFVPTRLQSDILVALNGKALKVEPLAARVSGGDSGRLYKPGGFPELKKLGKVQHKHGVGYYRPDAPPRDAEK